MTSETADFVSTNTNHRTNSPPPAYTVLPTDHEQSAAEPSQRQIPSVSPPPPSAYHHPPTPNPYPIPNLQPAPLPLPYGPPPQTHFGPTPLSSQYPLLPYAYYDSPVVADGRARGRFVGALMCGIGVWAVIGVIGGEIVWGGLFDWI